MCIRKYFKISPKDIEHLDYYFWESTIKTLAPHIVQF